MQQAISSTNHRGTTVGTSLSPKPVAPPRFVINLCASTTPVGLVHPTHAGLKRFTFFVSRRLEEGRERFRLHMGYFDTQEEAEKILDLVRDVYPAAWAGAAPGIKLRARAALPGTGDESTSPSPHLSRRRSRLAAVAEPAIAQSAPEHTQTVAALAAKPAAAPPESNAAPLKLELAPDLPRAKPTVPKPPANTAHDVTSSLSDVRATIASLSDTAETKIPTEPPALEGAAILRLLTSARPAPAARLAPMQPASKPKAPGDSGGEGAIARGGASHGRTSLGSAGAGRVCRAASLVSAAHRHEQGAPARDLQRLYALWSRRQSRRASLVRVAAWVLYRRGLGQAGGAVRAFGIHLRVRSPGDRA